jgi:hypothetical protein
VAICEFGLWTMVFRRSSETGFWVLQAYYTLHRED